MFQMLTVTVAAFEVRDRTVRLAPPSTSPPTCAWVRPETVASDHAADRHGADLDAEDLCVGVEVGLGEDGDVRRVGDRAVHPGLGRAARLGVGEEGADRGDPTADARTTPRGRRCWRTPGC